MRISFKIGTLSATAIAFSAMLTATPAHAQATRTWVDGVGDDANPCSKTAPCKTFAGAISKTAAGGEINCSDATGGGGFGTVTITKAMTINCDTVFASILNSGTNGVNVNAGPNDIVILNGLEINGAGTTTGTRGVNFNSGGTLIIRNCLIYGQQNSPANGVSFTPSGTSKLYIEHSTVANNGTGAAGGGVLIQPGASGSAVVVLRDLQVINNGGYGVRVDATTSTAGITVNADNVELSGNGTVGFNATASGTNPITAMLANSVISNNTTTGIVTVGSGVTVRVGNTTITGNTTGVNPATGTISSYGDNRLDGNTSNGAFSGAVLPKH
jgi:hypothetical protein